MALPYSAMHASDPSPPPTTELDAALPVGAFACDARGECAWTNPAFIDLSEWSGDDLAGRAWTDVLHPRDRERVAAEWHEASANGGEYRTECRLDTDEGGQWVLVRLHRAPERSVGPEFALDMDPAQQEDAVRP